MNKKYFGKKLTILDYNGDFKDSNIGDPSIIDMDVDEFDSISQVSPNNNYGNLFILNKRIEFTEGNIGVYNITSSLPQNSKSKTESLTSTDEINKISRLNKMQKVFNYQKTDGFKQSYGDNDDDNTEDTTVSGQIDATNNKELTDVIIEMEPSTSSMIKHFNETEDLNNYYNLMKNKSYKDVKPILRKAKKKLIKNGELDVLIHRFIQSNTQTKKNITFLQQDMFDEQEDLMFASIGKKNMNFIDQKIYKAKDKLLNNNLIVDEIGKEYISNPSSLYKLLYGYETLNSKSIKKQILKIRNKAKKENDIHQDQLNFNNNLSKILKSNISKLNDLFEQYRKTIEVNDTNKAPLFIHPSSRTNC